MMSDRNSGASVRNGTISMRASSAGLKNSESVRRIAATSSSRVGFTGELRTSA